LPDLPQLSLENFASPIRQQIQKASDNARANPQDATANGRLGMLLHAYQQNEAAAVCFERARTFDSKESSWSYYLGTVQAALGNHSEAVVTLRESLRQKPDYLPAQLRLAEALLASGKSEESRELYESILHKHPDSALAHYGMGRVKSGQKDLASALDHFLKACEISPNFGASHYALALAYRDLDDKTKAQEHLSLYQKDKLGWPVSRDPLSDAVQELRIGAHHYLKQGTILEAAGQLEQAAAAHERALEIDPKLEQAHINLISLYGRLRQPGKAEAQYKSLLALNPNLAEAHYNFGVLLTGQGRHSEASDAFRKALEISPFYAEAHNNVAFLLLNEGRLEEAARHFRSALENKPNYRLAHFHLGRILLHQNKTDEAIEHFQQTLGPEEDDSTPGYFYALGAAYARKGNRQSALEYIRQAQRRASALGQKELLGSIERDLRILEQSESRK
ncbi:MAG: tetratricopeptide repeat protein, partial [Terriglobia bacterium]